MLGFPGHLFDFLHPDFWDNLSIFLFKNEALLGILKSDIHFLLVLPNSLKTSFLILKDNSEFGSSIWHLFSETLCSLEWLCACKFEHFFGRHVQLGPQLIRFFLHLHLKLRQSVILQLHGLFLKIGLAGLNRRGRIGEFWLITSGDLLSLKVKGLNCLPSEGVGYPEEMWSLNLINDIEFGNLRVGVEMMEGFLIRVFMFDWVSMSIDSSLSWRFDGLSKL